MSGTPDANWAIASSQDMQKKVDFLAERVDNCQLKTANQTYDPLHLQNCLQYADVEDLGEALPSDMIFGGIKSLLFNDDPKLDFLHNAIIDNEVIFDPFNLPPEIQAVKNAKKIMIGHLNSDGYIAVYPINPRLHLNGTKVDHPIREGGLYEFNTIIDPTDQLFGQHQLIDRWTKNWYLNDNFSTSPVVNEVLLQTYDRFDVPNSDDQVTEVFGRQQITDGMTDVMFRSPAISYALSHENDVYFYIFEEPNVWEDVLLFG